MKKITAIIILHLCFFYANAQNFTNSVDDRIQNLRKTPITSNILISL